MRQMCEVGLARTATALSARVSSAWAMAAVSSRTPRPLLVEAAEVEVLGARTTAETRPSGEEGLDRRRDWGNTARGGRAKARDWQATTSAPTKARKRCCGGNAGAPAGLFAALNTVCGRHPGGPRRQGEEVDRKEALRDCRQYLREVLYCDGADDKVSAVAI